MAEAKEVLLIRHGQSETNRSDVHQAGDQVESDPLTAEGQQAARTLAERFGRVALDVTLSSGYRRALQTAQAIAAATGSPLRVPLLQGDTVIDAAPEDGSALRAHPSLLREIDVPSELAGLPFDDPAALAIKAAAREYEFQPDLRYSDEENLHDLWRRAEAIRTYLESRPERTIAVVAHGGILKVWLAHIMFADATDHLTAMQQMAAYRAFARSTWWDNTGVLSVEYSPADGWRWLMTDNAHLGPKYFSFMPKGEQETPGGDTTEGESRYLE